MYVSELNHEDYLLEQCKRLLRWEYVEHLQFFLFTGSFKLIWTVLCALRSLKRFVLLKSLWWLGHERITSWPAALLYRMLPLGFWSSFSSKDFSLPLNKKNGFLLFALLGRKKSPQWLWSISFKYGFIPLLISRPLCGTWKWLFDKLGLLSSFVIFVGCSPRSLKIFFF